MTIRVEENESKRTSCPFCHGLIARGEPVWECPRCETVHHLECAHENKRCTILGCQAKPPSVAPTAVSAQQPATAPPRAGASAPARAVLVAACIAASAGFSLYHLRDLRETQRHDSELQRRLETVQRELEAQEWEIRRDGIFRLTASVLGRAGTSPADQELATNEFNEAQSLYFQILLHERGDAIRADLRAHLVKRYPDAKVDALLDELARGKRR